VAQLLPTKLLGIVTDHGDYPVERIVIDRAGEGRWVGSVGHEDVLKLTDLKEIFEDEDEDDVEGEASEDVDAENEQPGVAVPELVEEKKKVKDSDSDEPEPEGGHGPKKRKKKQTKDPLAKKREKKARNQIVTDPSFFSGL
jgi:hypothetical protein